MNFIPSNTKKTQRILQLITISYISIVLLPKIVRQGIFPDGLTYSSIARNMAIGKGSFWEPYFSSTFWLPFNSTTVFYEHPPLMMWIQSLFFRTLGDNWYVEKLYNVIILIITLSLISKIWTIFYTKEDPLIRSFNWLVVLFFYTIPTIIWSFPNNMLDNTMGMFCVASVLFSLKALIEIRKVYINAILSAIFIALAFLTKGPIGIFPLAIPFIHYFIFKPTSLSKHIKVQLIIVITCIIWGLILLQYTPARDYLSQYVSQQVFKAVAGEREALAGDWITHSQIIIKLIIQLLPPIFLTIVILTLSRIVNKAKIDLQTVDISNFFLVVAISASLPIAISPKQSSFYLIPSLPFFSLAFVSYLTPRLYATLKNIAWKKSIYINIHRCLSLIIILIVIYSYYLFGSIRRDGEIIRDLYKIAQVIPNGSKLYASPASIQDFYTQTYFQRYNRLELSPDSLQKFLLIDAYSTDSLLVKQYQLNYKELTYETERYHIYKRNIE